MTEHGGNTALYHRQYGKQPLDFSANVNPMGLPFKVAAAIEGAILKSDGYPDPQCHGLVQALSQKEGMEPEGIVCGNGAADILFRAVLAQRPRKALLLAPTFSEYENALTLAGCGILYHSLRAQNEFVLEESYVGSLTAGVDMAFLCTPNNPTGQLTDMELMRKILKVSRDKGITLVVDECFIGFVENGQDFSVRPFLRDNPHVLVVDAFTKLYGMAGVRLGYGLCADFDLIARIKRAGPPWQVSTLAQAAGEAALLEEEYVESALQIIREEKGYLLGQLARLGMPAIGHAANYLFFRCDDLELDQKLKEYAILIRSCANYRGLSKAYFRIAVRMPGENRRLIQALEEIRGQKTGYKNVREGRDIPAIPKGTKEGAR